MFRDTIPGCGAPCWGLHRDHAARFGVAPDPTSQGHGARKGLEGSLDQRSDRKDDVRCVIPQKDQLLHFE